MTQKILFKKQSHYQLIEIVEDEYFGRMLFLDKDLQEAENDAFLYNRAMVAPLKLGSLNSVCILGGGDGGVLYELLSHNPKHVDLVEIDNEVILASKKYMGNKCQYAFDDPRVNIVIKDATQYLEQLHSYDAVIVDLTAHPESPTSNNTRTFYHELFLKIKNNIKNNGRISLQCCSSFDQETYKFMKAYLARHFKNITFREVYIPSFADRWIFASAQK